MDALQPLAHLTRQSLERRVTDAAYRAAGESIGFQLAGHPCRARLRYNPAAFVAPLDHQLVEPHVILTKQRLAYPDVTIRARAMGHAAIGLREEGLKGLNDPNTLREFANMTADFAGRDLATVPVHEIETAVKAACENWFQIEPHALALIAGFEIPEMIGDQDSLADEDDEDDYPTPGCPG